MAYYFNEREEQILEILWKTGNGFMKDILTQMPNNEQLPYNTVLSMVRKLEGCSPNCRIVKTNKFVR